MLTATLRDASGNVLSGRSISWTSSDLSVANGDILDEAVAIDGLSAGAATITATSEGVSGSATITVVSPGPAPVASITVSPTSAILDIGDSIVLTATLRDASGNVLSGRSISWTSSDLSVANGTFLDEALAIDGLSAGAATITATSEGVSGSATITVLAPPPPPPFSLTCSTVAGGSIFADDGQYLGSLTNRFSSDSILNEFGSYGGQFSTISIYNQFSSYGSAFASLSAYNEFTVTPPVLYVNGVSVAYVTKNSFKTPRVDPDALKACSW